MDSNVPQSAKNLWVLLSGSTILKSKEFIGSELKKSAPKIINGILYFKERSENQTQDHVVRLLEKNKIKDIPSDFLVKLSELLNVDPLQCYELFLAYLLYEYKGTPKTMKTLFSNEKNLQDLLEALWKYYFSERLFALLCLKQILSHWHNSEHPYRQLFDGFFNKANEGNKVFKKLMEQFKHNSEQKLPNRLTHGHYFSEKMTNNWIHYHVKESFELTQLFILYFKTEDPTVEDILNLFTLFQRHAFCSRYPYKKQMIEANDEKSHNLLNFTGFSQSILLIECLQLDWLFKCIEEDITEHFFLKNNQSIKKLDSMIVNSDHSLEVMAPIFLSWMVVRSFDVPQLVLSPDPKVIKDLGSTALQNNVFTYLEKMLNSSNFENLKNTPICGTIKTVIIGVISTFFSIYGLNLSEPQFKSLFSTLSFLLDDNSVAAFMVNSDKDHGIRIVTEHALAEFPYRLKFVLNICIALAKSNYCLDLFKLLSSLSSYTEIFDYSSHFCVPTENDYVYQLMTDRMLLSSPSLILKKNTLGRVKVIQDAKSSYRIIRWENINLNGWEILLRIFREKLLHSSNKMETLEGAYEDVHLICVLIATMVKTKPELQPKLQGFIDIAAEGFKRFSLSNNQPHLYMAAFLDLYSALTISSSANAKLYWEFISQSGFFPYMIGLTNDWSAIINGQDTNSSKIGRIIASEECVKGEYELTVSYLNFFSLIIPHLNDDTVAQATLIHIITEIFPCHNLWFFKNLCYFKKIGKKCFEIFHQILTFNHRTPDSILVKICKGSLLGGPAGESILRCIINGEEHVREIIEDVASDTVLYNDERILMIRQSFSVLNRLLALQVKIKSESSETHAVEDALFSSHKSGRQNMLLILSHYVFQRYDVRLATLAIQLLKRIAKHYPMSMLACLGSEAESFRDHLLFRLEEVTEDLNLKIALLDFLAVLVKHQPGLMEMFLNVDHENNDNETENCLRTVLEILEEKQNNKYFCPEELHCATIKFLYTFWLQPHLLAIDSLKKSSNMWDLLCFPVIENNFNKKIRGYILRIIAREIFYVKTLERDKFDSSLEKIFQKFKKEDHLKKISTEVLRISRDKCTSLDDAFFLSSWRDIIISLAKFEPFELDDETKFTLLHDLIESMKHGLENEFEHNRIILFSDTLITIQAKWTHCISKNLKLWKNCFTSLLCLINEGKDGLSFGSLNSVINLLNSVLAIINKLNGDENLGLIDWVPLACELYIHSLCILEKQIHSKVIRIELKLIESTITLLNLLFLNLKSEQNLFLKSLRNHNIIGSLVSLLVYLMEHKISFQLAESIMCILITLSSMPSAELLKNAEVVNHINLSLDFYKLSDGSSQQNDWAKMFHLSLELVTSLLVSLNYHFVEDAIHYVTVQLNSIQEILRSLRQSPSQTLLDEACYILIFLNTLTKYKKHWIKQHDASHYIIVEEVSKTCYSIAAFMLRPNFIQYTMENSLSTSLTTLKDGTPKKLSFHHQEIENDNPLKKIVTLEDQRIGLKPEIEKCMIKLLTLTVNFLHDINPNVLQVLSLQGIYDDQIKLQLDTSFSSPNIDSNKTASFGTLLYCVNLSIKILSKIDRTSLSDRKPTNKQLIKVYSSNMLEKSLSLIISQAIISRNCPDIQTRDKQMIAREVKNELTSILSVISRHHIKRGPNLSMTSTPKSPTNTISDRPFVRFLTELIEKVF